MSDLAGLAQEALAHVNPDDDRAVRTRQAAKFMHDRVGGPLPPLVQAIREAMDHPVLALTRAAKERAVAEMTRRLTVTAGRYDRHRGTPFIEGHARAMRRQETALLRLAMTRTVD